MPRPYVLLSVAASLDGCIDDTSATRLVLSDEDDFDRVDAERAAADAILVGAGTIRADNPRLLVRSPSRQAARIAAGKPYSPAKVTFTRTGSLDPASQFFTTGDVPKLVYAPSSVASSLSLGPAATVVGAASVHDALADMHSRGISRLMVEGGGHIHTQFLAADVVDELHLVHAPFFVGSASAPRFVYPASFPQSPSRPMSLSEVRQIGDLVLLKYLVTSHG
ncbi:RibD family protein [Amycolatopsis sp. YIM 10]|uniref:RibD family protein n=1 Tax=Amycolatopsis sp. YIM 10 TaxID=2653857 RepID=UPI0012A87037|nr:2,5-diamino-6-ribosylamino-4(3H)-pyrimidinone 5'-phosphate reductase [Amycolatopsis sp. YIM 10]